MRADDYCNRKQSPGKVRQNQPICVLEKDGQKKRSPDDPLVSHVACRHTPAAKNSGKKPETTSANEPLLPTGI